MRHQIQSTRRRPSTRIQRDNRERILDAALDIFSRFGFRGSTLDQIAERAGLSKPNLLYYYSGKEEIHRELLTRLLEKWLAPLQEINPNGDPISEIVKYVRKKLEMAQDSPRESRLFANEIIQGAPVIEGFLRSELRVLVDDAAQLMDSWSHQGKIAPVNAKHLIFSIWATTQHYSDFDAQVKMVLGTEETPFEAATEHLETMYRRVLDPLFKGDK